MAAKTRKRMPGGLGVPKPLYGPPQFRPLQGTETRPNPDGYSTEITMTTPRPAGGWMVHPSLWMGPQGPVEVPEQAARKLADLYERFGYRFPRFPSLAASEDWAVKRSKRGGIGLGPLARKR